MIIEHFSSFLTKSPTALHAVETIKQELRAHQFQQLKETDTWKLKRKERYFIADEGSLIAFILPEKACREAHILSSHTDSPALKLKPHAESIKEGMTMWGVEIYGAPLLNSWLNRDLGVAGKVLFQNTKKETQEALVNIKSSSCVIPQIAIHLDREVNEKGLLLNKQEHLSALAGLQSSKDYLLSLLKKELPIKTLLAHDLFLYPLEPPKMIGNDLFAAYRLDSLASVFAILTAFLEKPKAKTHALQMIAFFDHEEIGSGSSTGAESPFLTRILERIILNLEKSREAYLQLLPRSFLASVDLGHAIHPNYSEKHDPLHKAPLGGGVIIKTHAQKKYATDTKSARLVIETAIKHKIPYQVVSGRNDIPSGSTIGPIQAALTGISTVDIGIAQLSMHSARELIAIDDLSTLTKLLSALRDSKTP